MFACGRRNKQAQEDHMDEDVENRAVELDIRDKNRVFDVDDPILPDWVEEKALASGDFPYKKKLAEEDYLEQLEKLQVELVKVQFWLQATGKRVMALFEGRDAAGKGGAISASSAHMNPRLARVVVFPALYRAVSDIRRVRAFRPLLVQPRRRRAGHGLLHAAAI
jgi:polyphosphate kinase 2 (PPK2 family)